MKTEQQINQTQTKKSTGIKKDKKLKPKTVVSEENSEKNIEQQESKTLEVVVEQEVKLNVTETVPVLENLKSSEEVQLLNNVVLQELDFPNVVEFINLTSDKLVEYSKYFKDNNLSKDERLKIETVFKKFQKSTNTILSSYHDYLSRQVSNLEKNSGSKSGGAKKIQDKEKSAIHKKLVVHPFLLKFMNLEDGTLVSRSDVLTAITTFVKQEKEKNPDIILSSDKRSFKLVGDLKVLFDGIEKVMVTKNLLNDGKQMPTEIKYTQIMQYMTHCFIKSDEATVV